MRGVSLKPYFYQNRINLQGELKYHYMSKDLNYLLKIIGKEIVCYRDNLISDIEKDIHESLGPLLEDEVYFLIAQSHFSHVMFEGKGYRHSLADHWCLGVCKIYEMHIKATIKQRRSLRDFRGQYVINKAFESKDSDNACYKLDDVTRISYNRSYAWFVPDARYIRKDLDLNYDLSILDIQVRDLYDIKNKKISQTSILIQGYNIMGMFYYTDKIVRENLSSDYVLGYSIDLNETKTRMEYIYFKGLNLKKYLYEKLDISTGEIANYLDLDSLCNDLVYPHVFNTLGFNFDLFEFYGFKELFRT